MFGREHENRSRSSRPEVLYEKSCFKKCLKIHSKSLVLESLFKKNCRLQHFYCEFSCEFFCKFFTFLIKQLWPAASSNEEEPPGGVTNRTGNLNCKH